LLVSFQLPEIGERSLSFPKFVSGHLMQWDELETFVTDAG